MIVDIGYSIMYDTKCSIDRRHTPTFKLFQTLVWKHQKSSKGALLSQDPTDTGQIVFLDITCDLCGHSR